MFRIKKFVGIENNYFCRDVSLLFFANAELYEHWGFTRAFPAVRAYSISGTQNDTSFGLLLQRFLQPELPYGRGILSQMSPVSSNSLKTRFYPNSLKSIPKNRYWI